ENMGGPAGCAAYGESGREEVTGQSDGGQQGGGIEFDVGVETAARLLFLQDGQRQLFDAACQDKFLRVGEAGQFAQFVGAGISGLVDAVAEAHQAISPGDGTAQPALGS